MIAPTEDTRRWRREMAPDPGSTRLTREGRCWLLSLLGEHDVATIPLLDRRMDQVWASGANVVIDLSEAAFIDCSVVGWVLHRLERARSVDRLHLAVVVGESGTAARRVFELLNMNGVVPFAATREDAVTMLGRSVLRCDGGRT